MRLKITIAKWQDFFLERNVLIAEAPYITSDRAGHFEWRHMVTKGDQKTW